MVASTVTSPLVYNEVALGRYWHLIDLPVEWPGYFLLAASDADGNLQLDAHEESRVDWFAFTEAVQDFQVVHNLVPVDGKLGPATLQQLQQVYAARDSALLTQPEPLLALDAELTLYRPSQPTAEPSWLLPHSSSALEQSIIRLWNRYGAAIQAAAKSFDLPVNSSLAVFQVESKTAYDPVTGLLMIRFEPHVFKRYTQRSVVNQHNTQANEWQAFKQAYAIDPEAALLSTSYGLPQLMGFNWSVTTYGSVGAMVAAFQDSCVIQIMGFFEFVAHNNLAQYLQRQDWAGFVRRYNGPGNVPVYTQRLTRALSVVDFFDQNGAQWEV